MKRKRNTAERRYKKMKGNAIIVIAMLMLSFVALPFAMAVSGPSISLGNDDSVSFRSLSNGLGELEVNSETRSRADLNRDGIIGQNDLEMLINSWGRCGLNTATSCTADINLDKTVNVNDLLILLNSWTEVGEIPELKQDDDRVRVKTENYRYELKDNIWSAKYEDGPLTSDVLAARGAFNSKDIAEDVLKVRSKPNNGDEPNFPKEVYYFKGESDSGRFVSIEGYVIRKVSVSTDNTFDRSEGFRGRILLKDKDENRYYYLVTGFGSTSNFVLTPIINGVLDEKSNAKGKLSLDFGNREVTISGFGVDAIEFTLTSLENQNIRSKASDVNSVSEDDRRDRRAFWQRWLSSQDDDAKESKFEVKTSDDLLEFRAKAETDSSASQESESLSLWQRIKLVFKARGN